jgi:hypothetical protein
MVSVACWNILQFKCTISICNCASSNIVYKTDAN